MRDCPYQIVVVGTSLGGLNALQILLSGLPKNFSLPVAIVQHRHKSSDESLSVFLQQYCALPLTEAEDKEAIAPGHVYIAPADYHLLVELRQPNEDSLGGHGEGTPTFALSTEAPVCYARPSIDVLFESAAEAYPSRVIGVILTGASNDGSQGLVSIKAHGGLAVVQEPTTAECSTMPRAAMNALQQRYSGRTEVASNWIMPLQDIAPFIVNLCQPALR